MFKSTRPRGALQSPPAAQPIVISVGGGSRLFATVPPPPALPPFLSAFFGPKRELSDDAGADRELCPFARGAHVESAPEFIVSGHDPDRFIGSAKLGPDGRVICRFEPVVSLQPSREGWDDDCRTDDPLAMLRSLALVGVGMLLGWLTSGIFSAIWSGLKALWRLL